MLDLKPACHRMADLLAGVTDDQLPAPTPCTEYTVGDLVAHVDEVARGFTAIAGSTTSDDTGAVPGDDGWRERVAGHVRALGAAWDRPEAWRGASDGAGLELPNEQWGRIALTEMVVHGWDLATATGQRLDLPETTLRACLDHVTEFVPNAPIPSLWGAAVDVPAGAPLIDRVVATTGRAPH